LPASSKNAPEIAALIGVYILFLAVGMYSGHVTMNLDLTGPPEAASLRSSPVELVAKVTVRGQPLSDVVVRFTIQYSAAYEVSFEIETDTHGTAKLTFPARSGNYTWIVTATKDGYPTIRSIFHSFSVTLSLSVDGLLPSSYVVATSPVNFKARAKDAKGTPLESANVTFYVDFTMVGFSLTDPNGIARFSGPVEPGTHSWFASASKHGEGGISDTTHFTVESLSFVASEFDSSSRDLRLTDGDVSSICGSNRSCVDIHQRPRQLTARQLSLRDPQGCKLMELRDPETEHGGEQHWQRSGRHGTGPVRWH